MSYANRVTHRLHYDVVGDAGAPPVLLVMGMAFSSRAWDTLPARLASDGMRVIVFDNRGTGRSERPKGFFTIADMADDAAAVLDAVNVDKAHVFGISLGGMVSLELALRHAARVQTLALGCTYASWLASHKPKFKVTRTLVSSSLSKEKPGRERLEQIAPVLISDATWQGDRARFADWMLRVERGEPRVLGLQLAAGVRHNTTRRLAQLQMPTLVVTGALDRLIPPANSRALAKRIRNAKLVEIAGAGHCFPFEKLDETAATLMAHFRGAAASAGSASVRAA